jgi:hypothetical protein
MSKIVWGALIFLLVEAILSYTLGIQTDFHAIIAHYSGNKTPTVILLVASLYVILWGLFRLVRGGGRLEGLMVVLAVLAINYLTGKVGYTTFNDLFKLIIEYPKISAGIVIILILFSKKLREGIKSLWKRSKGEPKPEKEKKAKGELGLLGEARLRIWKKTLGLIKKNRKLGSLFSNYLGKVYQTPEGELPFMLKDLRVELYTLLNLLLRNEIWRAKHASLRSKRAEMQQKEEHMQEVEETEESLRDSLKKNIEGGEIEIFRGADGLMDFRLKPEGLYGVARKSIFIYELMKMLRNELQSDLRSNSHPAVRNDKYVENQNAALGDLMEKKIVKIAFDRYKSTIMRFKVLNFIRARRLWFMDMYNFSGQYARGFNFAKKGALPLIYVVSAEDNGVQREIDWDSAAPVGIGGAGRVGVPTDYEPETSQPNRLVEVNLFGYAVRDINAIQIEKTRPEALTPQQFPNILPPLSGGRYYIRKYKKEDIVYFFEEKAGRFFKTLTQSEYEWGYGVEDMLTGRLHPYSRGLEDYQSVITSGSLNFDNARFERLLPYNAIAYDREALKDPGKLVYWGRKYYDDETPDSPRNRAPVNPYPTISVFGLWYFISRVALKHTEETQLVADYLNNYWRMRYEILPEVGTQAQAQGGQA